MATLRFCYYCGYSKWAGGRFISICENHKRQGHRITREDGVFKVLILDLEPICGCDYAYFNENAIECDHGKVLPLLYKAMCEAIENEANLGTLDVEWWGQSFRKQTKAATKKIGAKIDEGTCGYLLPPLIDLVVSYL